MSAEWSHQRLADLLNDAGIKNRASENPLTIKPWTAGALRPLRKDVMGQIALDDEPIDDNFVQISRSGHPEAREVPSEGTIGQTPSYGVSHSAPLGFLKKAFRWGKKLLSVFSSKGP